MPRIEASKGKGRIVETGNIIEEGREGKPEKKAQKSSAELPLFTNPSYWADAPITIVLSGCVWVSAGGNQRPVAISRELVRAGHHVVYVCAGERSTQWAGGPLIMTPGRLHKEIASLLSSTGTVICALPTPKFAELCDGLQDNGWTVIYDVLDDWKAFYEDGYSGWYQEDLERALMESADALTASAEALVERVADWTGREATLVPNGGPSEAFKPRRRPPDMLQGSQGSAVYSGHLVGTWFHWCMLAQTVRDLPDVGFTIVGDHTGCNLPEAPNIEFVGEKPYNKAMDYVQNADVGIIPFQSDAVCEAVDPIKWYDYVAGCCRTVATWPLTELHGRPLTDITPKGVLTMAPQIREALQKPEVTVDEANRVLEETDASWESRARDLMAAGGVSL